MDDLNNSIGEKKFNKNANPFYPASISPKFNNEITYLIKIENLPNSIEKLEFLKLIESIIETNFEEKIEFEILKFTSYQIIIEFFNYNYIVKMIEILNGYEWLGKFLEVRLLNDFRKNSINSPNDSVISSESSLTSLLSLNPFYNPYFPNFPYQYNYDDYSTNTSLNYGSRKSSDSNSKSLPPFLMNLVGNQQKSDENFIIVEDDEKNPIKVNPCRLFIGNIPFNSTWTSLRNFLINKLKIFEPNNNIEILRVEIPMQPSSNLSLNSLNRLNNYQFLSNYSNAKDANNSLPPKPNDDSISTRGLSRGFAIVTTANQSSLEKIIKYFNDIEFEGRSLTVRFDKFPEFNNYILQQLNPINKHHSSAPPPPPVPPPPPSFSRHSSNSSQENSNHPSSKSSIISNLAFERNLIQNKIYSSNSSYENTSSPSNSFVPFHPMYNIFYPYPNHPNFLQYHYPPPGPIHPPGPPPHGDYTPFPPSIPNPLPTSGPPNSLPTSLPPTPPVPVPVPVPIPMPIQAPETSPNEKRRSKKRLETKVLEEIQEMSIKDDKLTDDEKARELMNSFTSIT